MKMRMKMSKMIPAALLAVTLAGAPALAQDMQDGMMMKEGMMMMIMPDGRMSTMQPSDKMMSDMMMNHGKPITTTHIMMMRDGKVHMMEDKKMSDGKMMSEHMMMAK